MELGDIIDNDDEVEQAAEEIEKEKERQRLQEKREDTKYGGQI